MVKRVIKRRRGRNKFEQDTSTVLDRAGIDFTYEGDKIPYTIHGLYNPDYTVRRTRGGIVYLETKGYFRVESKRKMVAVKKCNPDLDIRLIFYGGPNTKGNRSNVKWATKYGFPYAFHTIPQEWIEEFTKCT